jgi:NAD(P)-dependent dehydrogenase (short-subunit alcohol dehydrogenase family)
MKNFLIIGASSGIGAKLADQLLNKGHRVIGTSRSSNPENAPEHLEFHPLDVTDEPLDLPFLPEVLDGIVYCPGSIVLRPFHRIKPASFLEDYNLQVVGAVRVIQQCLTALRRSDQPSVLFFSTVAVQTGFNFHSLVSASKGALEGLTKALAAELAPAIRVNCVAPSLTDTPLASNLLNNEAKREANAERHPLKRVGKPGDIASMAQFLLSGESSWITGQVFHVDGGISSLRI